ncbi:MAG: beta-galactosidase [Ruminococcaceae bacterium]|nr:beta-galactosidase [Oscillospiraceae bacterium]
MIYRTEHPKPQFERADWINLNGEWQFEIDDSKSGAARGLQKCGSEFSKVINVPFCPESKLSGIAYTDFMYGVWYKRSFTLSAEQLEKRVVLHFGAVDYEATVYINGNKCGSHKGGYVSFSFDISEYVVEGENVITVNAVDDTRSRLIPSGKQSLRYESHGCYYTRTTGIWQTVWLEFTPKTYIKCVKYYPTVENCSLTVNAELCGGGEFVVKASYEGEPMGEAKVSAEGGFVSVNLPLKEKHLWEVGKGGLYDLELSYGEDKVKSYFGLRSIEYKDYKFFLNGKSVFQRLILDQGFYPDGIYTAPSDGELIADIERSVAMGFNGARLHEKVFEERFLYHADRLGYLVWGEFPNWGLDVSYADSIYAVLPEWIEEVERDFNHPAIVGWCPFNETWDEAGRKQFDQVLSLVYDATKAMDHTRPCIDTSGNYHVKTDIYDVHNYEQKPDVFASHYAELKDGGKHRDHCGHRQKYDGKMPFFVSEYGGIRWTDDTEGWGYGEGPKTEEEFIERLKGLTDVLLDNDRMFGYCYTQLTDVEQEQNGLYTYDRKPKFDPAIISAIFGRKAAVED